MAYLFVLQKTSVEKIAIKQKKQLLKDRLIKN